MSETNRVSLTTTSTVEITINDPYVIERVTGPEGDEWRASLYPLHTREDVLAHLAYNAVLNGSYKANMLDGWADLGDDAAVMLVVSTDVDEIIA